MLQLPGTTSDVDLAPQQLLPQIDRLNDLIYNQVEQSSAMLSSLLEQMSSSSLALKMLQLVT
jgi:hypothetical protein